MIIKNIVFVGVVLLCFYLTMGCATILRTLFPLELSKKVSVYGVTVYASRTVSDEKLLHTAYVLAEYLDNNEDGQLDDPTVIQFLKSADAAMLILKNEDEESIENFPFTLSQLLYDFEIHPQGSSAGNFDATLEEVLHLISDYGYAHAYPSAFGVKSGSLLTQYMDQARGGHFKETPAQYPNTAWFTYNDGSCSYSCMATEYFYWALTSILGAQEFSGRESAIANEWKLNTASKVQSDDSDIYTLLTDPKYKLPTQIPDGIYLPRAFEIERI